MINCELNETETILTICQSTVHVTACMRVKLLINWISIYQHHKSCQLYCERKQYLLIPWVDILWYNYDLRWIVISLIWGRNILWPRYFFPEVKSKVLNYLWHIVNNKKWDSVKPGSDYDLQTIYFLLTMFACMGALI